jgi:hypothetical protein
MNDIKTYNPEEEKRKQFFLLREQAQIQAEQDLAERIRSNPTPTEEENRFGCFIEMLEPQVREAVFELNRRGYQTFMSGFNGRSPEEQFINLNEGFEFPTEINKSLEDIGVYVRKYQLGLAGRGEVSEIGFLANEPDLAAIKTRWDTIMQLIPDTGKIAPQNNGRFAISFRSKFSPG